MAERVDALIGAAGVYYVAARLSAMGYHAAATVRNVPNVDLLVSSLDGSASISLQVKTSSWALRMSGRGTEKKPHHYEWSMSWKSARLNRANLLFAFVDLKDFESLPDVFLIPSGVVNKYYEGGEPETWKWPRYHPEVSEIEKYKNGWELVGQMLSTSASVR